QRLGRLQGSGRSTLVQADVFASSFPSAAFDVVLCLHVAHVLENLEGLLAELRRLLKPGGRLFLSSVVLAGTWRDGYLRMLAGRGIMASPRTVPEVLEALRRHLGAPPEYRQAGSMLFTETLVHAAKSFGIRRWYTRYEDLCKLEEVQAISIVWRTI